MMTTETAAPAVRGTPSIWPWLALPLRLVLFAAGQALFAAMLMGKADPWLAAGAWWPLIATIANLATLGILVLLHRTEGGGLASLFRIQTFTWKTDLPIMAGVTLVALPLAVLPNIALASLLFGDSAAALDLLVRPLPLWAVLLASVAFPLTIAFAELPLYFGYAMPRIEEQTGSRWLAVMLPSLFLAAQHVTLPLVFDWRFAVWRLVMFVPFAVFLGIVLRWRLRLLPYLMALHALLDAATMATFFARIG